MPTYNKGLLCNIEFYNAMLKAYADGMTEFEYAGCCWITDDICIDFIKDLQRGKLKVTAKENI